MKKSFKKIKNIITTTTTFNNSRKSSLRKSFTINTNMFFTNNINTNKNTFFMNSRRMINSVTSLTSSTSLANQKWNFSSSKRRKSSSAVVVVTKYFFSTTNFIIILNDVKSLRSSRKSLEVSRRSKSYARLFLSTLLQNSISNFNVTSNWKSISIFRNRMI